MEEFEEFALALLDQLSVEINEEKDITKSLSKAKQALPTAIKFDDIDVLSKTIFPKLADKVAQFTGISIPSEIKLEFLDLIELKQLKGKKVFATKDSVEFVDDLFTAIAHEDSDKMAHLMKKDPVKFLVYSTYAKSYISKISTTYGDYLDSTIFLNKFVLSSYPQIILQKQGEPYDAKFAYVNSGYVGALKMTILEEQIHAIQSNLHDINKKAIMFRRWLVLYGLLVLVTMAVLAYAMFDGAALVRIVVFASVSGPPPLGQVEDDDIKTAPCILQGRNGPGQMLRQN